MKMNQKDNVLLNRAKLSKDNSKQDVTDFDCCTEELIFAMQDRTHKFSIGLSTVLSCLAIAEKDGYVPPIDAEWWNNVRRY